MIAEAVVRRTIANREQALAYCAPEADSSSGVGRNGDRVEPGHRKPGSREVLAHRLARAVASARGPA